MSAEAITVARASPCPTAPRPSALELAELEGAILRLRQALDRCAGPELSLTAHFLNLAPSTTARLRLWMIVCTETGVELLDDPLAHLRPVDTLESGVGRRFLDRVAERLGLACRPC